ncbi:phage repressor protein CI [Veronia nyctiphanis]|uniref:phage repressor protein CI n=1 Tax=Veronia nyctiphanis TaxID=1278244 RepID=UPI001F1B57B3|nr:phage repressor protein CI [Veronia nyctiphanis]
MTEKLKSLTGLNTDWKLADYFGIPKSTIATWKERDMTPFEVVVRLHLATGVSIKWLTLDEGEAFVSANSQAEGLKIHTLKNGDLSEAGQLAVDLATLEHFGLRGSETLVVEQSDNRYFIDQSETKPTSGKYLIDIEGSLSVNQIQRLPGKLAIDFNGSTLEVAETDIKVMGRVAMTMSKD